MKIDDLQEKIKHSCYYFKYLMYDLKFKFKEFLHLRNDIKYYNDFKDYFDYTVATVNEDEILTDDVWRIGCIARSEMIKLNRTLNDLENKVKDDLPDYLINNLDKVERVGSVNRICLEFFFKNYSSMNHSLVNEIRKDFREATGLKELPLYKMDAYHDSFCLLFHVADYL